MAEAPAFDPDQPFEEVSSTSKAAPAFDPSQPFEDVAPSQHGVLDEAWRTTKEAGEGAWENLSHSMARPDVKPGEGFWEGYGRQLAETPQKAGQFVKGVAEAASLPLQPLIGAGKSVVGRAMSHGIHEIGKRINPEVAATQTPEGIYEDIRGDVGTALQAVAPRSAAGVKPSTIPQTPGPPRSEIAAGRDFARALERDNDTPTDLMARLQEARTIRPDATLADVGGENVRGILERVAQTPGAGRTTVVPALTGRQQGQMSRISNDLTTLTGTRQSAFQAVRDTMAERADAARPLYQEAYEAGDTAIWSPGLERLSSSPTVRAAMQGAVRIWQDNAVADGYGAMNPGALVDRGGQLSFLNGRVPVFPNLQFWDYTKRILDDRIQTAMRAGQNQKVRTLRQLAENLRNELDTHVPAYQEARNSWAGPSQYLDAIEEGRSILSSQMSAEELAANFADMSHAQQEAYRIGAVSAIRGKMGNDAAKMADMTKYLRSPEMRAKLAAIMPDTQAAESFMQRLNYEVSSSELVGRSLGNSATARRLAEKEDAENLIGDLVLGAIEHKSGYGLAKQALLALPKRIQAALRSRSDALLAELLTHPQADARLQSVLNARRQSRLGVPLGVPKSAAASNVSGLLTHLPKTSGVQFPAGALSQEEDRNKTPEVPRPPSQKNNGGRVTNQNNFANGGRVDPDNIHSSPTEAQKKAGNYAKDHVRIHGMDITIENAKGSKRSGVDRGGKKWSVSMPSHYGYIKKSEGADGDHVDVYLGPHTKSPHVFVIDQQDADSKKFDEHKCFLGFASKAQVIKCYHRAFSDGRASDRMGAIHEMDIPAFKDWLASGDATKAMAA